MTPTVVFATTVFEDVDTGPGIYARYLWEAFRDDPGLGFHVVAPNVRQDHPRLHTVLPVSPTRLLYDKVARRALRLALDLGGPVIIHGNAAHAMAEMIGYPHPWLVQVNDYEAAEVWKRPVTIARHHGPRRLASLAWRHRREGRVLKAAALSLCNSAYTRSRALACYPGLDEDRLRVVAKAVETGALRRPLSLPADPLSVLPGDHAPSSRILFVGADWRRKGLADLIEALPKVVHSIADIRLIIAGPAHSEHAAIKELARGAGVDANVILLGRVERSVLAALYWHASILVLPSRAEALGVSILEAMAAGLPVVATQVGGIPEIIRNDDEGLLVPAADPSALADAVLRLLQDGALRQRLASAGPVRAEDFSVSAMTSTVKAIYVELAEQYARGPLQTAPLQTGAMGADHSLR